MIHFDKTRWKQIEQNYTAWWNGESDRPLVKAVIKNAYAPSRPQPDVPLLSQITCNDFRYTPEQLIDRLDYELSKTEFLGDAFPYISMDCFGPSCVAGFCGAVLHNSTGNVWYMPENYLEIEDIHPKYDPNNLWVRRIKSVFRAAQERWGDSVLIGMPDIGGVQDVAAVLLGTDNLLLALMDEPEEVFRLQAEIQSAIEEAYVDFNSVLQPVNPGYSDWSGMYSKTPSYILQDDFAFMISNDMFEEFALQDIRKFCDSLSHAVYHLDGIGNLRHLESLLAIPNLSAIQWVPGAGQPSAANWMDVYKKIYNAGKGMEVIGDFEDFRKIASLYGNRVFYHFTIDDPQGTTKEQMFAKDCLNDYHVFPYKMRQEAEELLKSFHII